MQPLAPDYLAEVAGHLGFLSAFLGGFAATFLATLLVASSTKRVTGWIIVSAAFAACLFVIAVVGSVTLKIVLHPEVPSSFVSGSAVTNARVVSALAFVLGLYALLLSVGLSGWIRSRNTGIATSLAAFMGVVVVSWAIVGFG